MSAPFAPPEFGASAFHCPHCGAYAHQQWLTIYDVLMSGTSSLRRADQSYPDAALWEFSVCRHCDGVCAWRGERLMHPRALTAPSHHMDMPDDVAGDYDEARAIAVESPRAAAALLRLALQKLMPHLGISTDSLNDGIGVLVADGLPKQVQQALDTVRVIGNNAVHPGEIDLRDDPQTAMALFDLINFVVEDRIARPKAVSGLFDRLPDGAKRAVRKRDGEATV